MTHEFDRITCPDNIQIPQFLEKLRLHVQQTNSQLSEEKAKGWSRKIGNWFIRYCKTNFPDEILSTETGESFFGANFVDLILDSLDLNELQRNADNLYVQKDLQKPKPTGKYWAYGSIGMGERSYKAARTVFKEMIDNNQ